jgi:hypothetical protein
MNMISVPFGPLTSARVQVLPSVPGRLKSTAFHPKSQTDDWAAIGVSLPNFIVVPASALPHASYFPYRPGV